MLHYKERGTSPESNLSLAKRRTVFYVTTNQTGTMEKKYKTEFESVRKLLQAIVPEETTKKFVDFESLVRYGRMSGMESVAMTAVEIYFH